MLGSNLVTQAVYFKANSVRLGYCISYQLLLTRACQAAQGFGAAVAVESGSYWCSTLDVFVANGPTACTFSDQAVVFPSTIYVDSASAGYAGSSSVALFAQPQCGILSVTSGMASTGSQSCTPLRPGAPGYTCSLAPGTCPPLMTLTGN